MALQTTVKISNVTNLSDARYCAGMGVAMLGFSMDEDSPHYVSPAQLAELRGWVAGVQIIGETASTDPAVIEQKLADYQPDGLQLDEAALLPYFQGQAQPLVLRLELGQLTLEQLATLLQYQTSGADYVLLDSAAPLHMDEPLRQALAPYAATLLLGTGVSGDTVADVLAQLPGVGLALTGSAEDRPGSKDFGELMDVLEAIEAD